jgi:hypothetical protein
MESDCITHDPLLHAFKMPLRARYYPLGFTLELATNFSDVLKAADESWGFFQQTFSKPLLQFRIGVAEGGSDFPPAPVVRGQHGLVSRVADRENTLSAT